jgi:ribosomal protein S6--L-glutamate ligase
MDAAKARGHQVKLIRADKCELSYANGKMKALYGGKKFPDFDVIIPRVNITINLDLFLPLNKHLLFMGIPVLNGYMPIMRAKNKIRTLQILSHKGIPVPQTVVLQHLNYLDDAIKRVGGFPIILKTISGSLGRGVVIVESRRSLLSALDMILSQDHWRTLLVQEFVEEAEGKDVRVFVVGGRVVASMERTAKEGDFRSNIHAGGKGQEVELSKEEIEMSLKATSALGLDFSGVDLLRTKNGPVVMEVNANPGLEGITGATGIDVAGALIELAVSKAKQVPQRFRSLANKKELIVDEPLVVV